MYTEKHYFTEENLKLIKGDNLKYKKVEDKAIDMVREKEYIDLSKI